MLDTKLQPTSKMKCKDVLRILMLQLPQTCQQ